MTSTTVRSDRNALCTSASGAATTITAGRPVDRHRLDP